MIVKIKELINRNINLNKYFIASSEDRATSRVYSHSCAPTSRLVSNKKSKDILRLITLYNYIKKSNNIKNTYDMYVHVVLIFFSSHSSHHHKTKPLYQKKNKTRLPSFSH